MQNNSSSNPQQENIFQKSQYRLNNAQPNKSQASSGLNSVFQNKQFMQSGVNNNKTKNIIMGQLGGTPIKGNQEASLSPINQKLNQSTQKMVTQQSIQRGDTLDVLSLANLDTEQNFNQEKGYRPLNQAEILKYTNNKSMNKNKGECVAYLLHDEQEISTRKYILKRKELTILRTIFTDNTFPPNDSSLGFQTQSNELSWIRLSEIFKKGTLIPQQPSLNQLNTGLIQSDNLYCIYSILIRNQHLIRRLFENLIISDKGIYSIWLYINGCWKNFLIDDYIPVKQTEPVSLVFSSIQGIENNLWLPLLEKAFAKAYHSYSKIQIQEVYSTLVDFTGAPYLLIKKRDPNSQLQAAKKNNFESEDKNNLWVKIKSGLAKNYIITAKSQVTEKGLVQFQTYFIEDAKEFKLEFGSQIQVLKIWNCRWNQSVENFVNLNNLNQEQLKELKMDQVTDGIFYINLEEFYKNFDQIAIIRIETTDFQNSIKILQDLTSLKIKDIDSSTVRMKIIGKASGYISVYQRDIQSIKQQNYIYSDFTLFLAEVQPSGQLRYISQSYSNEKVIHFPFNLGDGIYVIHVEARWKQQVHRKFRISVSSDKQVGLQYYDYENNKLNGDTILRLIGKSFMQQYGIDFKQENTKLQGKKGQIGAFYIYYLKNITQKYILKQTIDIIDISNYNIVDESLIENKQLKFQLFPNEEFVIIFRIVQTQKASKIRLQFQQGSKVVYEDNKLETKFQKTLQAYIDGIDVMKEFEQIPDRKANFMNENFYDANTGGNDEESSHKSTESALEEVVNNPVNKYNKHEQGLYILVHKTTAITNYIIIFLIIFCSMFRCLEYDAFVYMMIYFKMISKEMKTSYLKTFILLQCLSVIYDITYIKLYSFNNFTSYTTVLQKASSYSLILAISKFTWGVLLFFKVIFTFMMVRVYVMKSEEMKYYYKQHRVILAKITFTEEEDAKDNTQIQQANT